MRRGLTKIEAASNWSFYAGGLVAAFVLLGMTLLIVVDVIGRKLGHSTGIAQEISGYALVLIVFASLAYCLREGSHIKIGIVTDRLAPEVRRWLKVTTSILAIAFIILVIWQTLRLTLELYTQNSTSMTPLHVPLWPLQMLVPLGLALLTIAILLETIKTIRGEGEG